MPEVSKIVMSARAGFSFSWETGKTYAIDVLVEGDQITVYVDGTEIVSVTNADIQSDRKSVV